MRDELASAVEEAAGGMDVRFARAGGLHITVKFLGDLARSDISSVTEAGRHASRGTGAFDLELAEPGAFPTRGRARVLWWGLRGELEILTALANRVDEAMAPFAARAEREFRPHVTVGRSRQRERADAVAWRRCAATIELAQRGFRVESMALYESALTSSGPVYRVLDRVAFD